MSKFLRGTMILLLAGLITRILGFINRIVIARFIGEEGVGLYMMAYPTLVLIVTITQLGLPVAISKNVAEAEARGDYGKIKKILVVSLTTTISLSIIFTPALFWLAPYLSKTLFTDPRIHFPLMAMTPIVPIVAVSSVLRGYFQGRQNMKPAAISQVLEQGMRITLIAVLTKTFLPYGIEYASAAAMFASVVGELVSLLYLMAIFKLRKKFRLRKHFFQYVHTGKKTFRELMSVALPTTGSRLIGSVTWFLEPIVVVQSLALAGVAAVTATKQYGALTGYALPLLMLPSFVTFALATSLVPAISEANSRGDAKLIEYRLQQSLRFSLIAGGLSMSILYVLAEPLTIVMYGSSSGASFIQLMAPFFLFNYFQGPLQASLQALNLAKAAMINSLIGAVVKTVVIFMLASQASFGINGAALGIIVGAVLVTFLHFATIVKAISFSFHVREYAKAFLVIFVSGWIGLRIVNSLQNNYSNLFQVIFATVGMSLIYLSLLIIFGLVTREELRRVPLIGKPLSKWAFR